MRADAQTPPQDRSIRRSSSEYVKSPHQSGSKFVQDFSLRKDSAEQQSMKAYYSREEAKVFAARLRPRVAAAVDQELGDWEVAEFWGDFVRKAGLKMRVGEDDFIHIFALRPNKKEAWIVRWAIKGEEDSLQEEDSDYESLPEDAVCGCSLM
eukprot:SRR837773.10.p1 GENE.SRR837773.10~~SRR837773.10.p1  ORF type:complete len:166 (-),score=47.84 SRR837773.10:85-540(-)